MDYNEFFKSIENHYFDDNFHFIVKIFEENADEIKLDYSREFDFKIVEAIATSYLKTGELSKSLIYIDQQLNYLNDKGSLNKDEEESLKYYLISKIHVLGRQGRMFKEYRMINSYLKKTGELNEQLLMGKKDIEGILYKNFLKFNKILGYIVVFLILAAIVCHLIDYQINNTLYSVYNIVSIIGIVWLLVNYYFQERIKTLFVKILRFIFI